MKITELMLRKIIREEIQSFNEEDTADVGKDIKGNTAAEKASQKMSTNKALVSAVDQITTTDSLASFIQDVVKLVGQKGINQNEAVTAIKKVLAALTSAKK